MRSQRRVAARPRDLDDARLMLKATVDATQEGRTMPRGASRKRERQYEHIKESYEDRGVSKDEAERRAARNRQQAAGGAL